MENIHITYIVHSDINEKKIRREFKDRDEAISYAESNADECTWVDFVEYDDAGRVLYQETIWSY